MMIVRESAEQKEAGIQICYVTLMFFIVITKYICYTTAMNLGVMALVLLNWRSINDSN